MGDHCCSEHCSDYMLQFTVMRHYYSILIFFTATLQCDKLKKKYQQICVKRLLEMLSYLKQNTALLWCIFSQGGTIPRNQQQLAPFFLSLRCYSLTKVYHIRSLGTLYTLHAPTFRRFSWPQISKKTPESRPWSPGSGLYEQRDNGYRNWVFNLSLIIDSKLIKQLKYA